MSRIFVAWPEIAFEGSPGHGVPLKSANTQVREFVICALALLYLAIDKARASEGRLAAGLFALAMAFLANIAYVTTNHWFIVPLVAIPGLTILLLLLAYMQFGLRVTLGLLLGVLFVCVMIYAVVPALSDPNTWSLLIGISPPVFWSKSLQFISEASIFGPGTASIRTLFAESAAGQTGVMPQIRVNPYQETLAVGVQFGIIGIALLWAMWIAHLWLFCGNRFADWIGLVVVIFAIIGSMVGSELFDFNQGWIYVFGVGVVGGITLRTRQQ